ncbi:hypothetical protein EC991_008801 [Linnemannia zychae]|nr:hypothetical protein EC991_008801 [Linnemannia zychae]
MRMIIHEGSMNEYHCRPLDLEFVDWIMHLIDSKLITEAAQTMRDLVKVVTASHTAGVAKVDTEDNCLLLSLAELAKIREESAAFILDDNY